MSGIYILTNIINNKIYVGETIQKFNSRWKTHKWLLRNGKHSNLYLQRSWDKYGEENFQFSILEEVDLELNKSELRKLLIEKEFDYIEKLESWKPEKGYNMKRMNGSNYIINEETKEKLRKPKSEETKEKIRKTLTGRKLSEEHKKNIALGGKGKKHTETTKEKMRKWHTGKVFSDKTKEKMSESGKRKILSEKHRRKMSESKTGKKLTEEHKQNLSLARKEYWKQRKSEIF